MCDSYVCAVVCPFGSRFSVELLFRGFEMCFLVLFLVHPSLSDHDFVSAVMISSVLVRIVPELGGLVAPLFFAPWQMSGTVIQSYSFHSYRKGFEHLEKRGQMKTTSCSGFTLSPYICSSVFSPCVAHGLPQKVKEATSYSCCFPRRAHFKMVEFALKLSWLPYFSVQGTCGSSCARWVMHGLMWQYKSPCRPMSTWS